MNKELGKLNIQLFAESGEGENPNTEGGTPPTGGEGNPNSSGKSYTQDQINSMMANEKRTARQALLKELGFEYKDDKDYKSVLKGIKETLDAGKTQAQKDAEAKQTAEKERDEANRKVGLLETRLSVLSAGANPEDLDDVITLVNARVNDSTNIEAAINLVKEKHPSLFTPKETPKGTGSNVNPAKKDREIEGLGKRLAKGNPSSTKKSAYFKS